jgi:hypothetical protein
MSRIRSIHPGIWTDEAFMSASAHARLLLLGIWTEAWDDGVFEWKALTLKARIFPVDGVDVAALLAELETLQFVCRFQSGGKEYGAIRNFQKYQRPKKPNSSGVLPENLNSWAGSSVPVPNQSGTSVEKSQQMEDGGWRMEEKTEAATAASCAAAVEKPDEKEIERRCVQATGWQSTQGFSAILDLIAEGHSLEDRILPMLRTIAGELRERGDTPPRGWAFVMKAIRDPTRRPAAAAKAVETVWVPNDSPVWRSLCRVKKESWLRSMLRPDGSGGEGIYWPVADLPPRDEAAA